MMSKLGYVLPLLPLPSLVRHVPGVMLNNVFKVVGNYINLAGRTNYMLHGLGSLHSKDSSVIEHQTVSMVLERNAKHQSYQEVWEHSGLQS